MVKLPIDGFTGPLAEIPKAIGQKQSPVLSKAEIDKSLRMRKMGPRHGKSFVGAGGLKPYRMPADGTKVTPPKIRTQKPLRAPTRKEN